MSSSAVSGGHHARWHEMQAQTQTQPKTAASGSSAPSSDLTSMLAGADPSQATAPPPPSTAWPSSANQTAKSGAALAGSQTGGSQIGTAASVMVSGVHSLLTSLQSGLFGGTTGAQTGTSTGTSTGTASSGPGTTDEAGMLGQIMQMLQAYGGQSSVASASNDMTSALTA